MDQMCDETVMKEKVDTALLRMMMDMGYENIQPHHMVTFHLPYFVHLILGVIICAAGMSKSKHLFRENYQHGNWY